MRSTKYEVRSTKEERRFRPSSFVLRPCGRRRRGISIIEVLFAILITTVGLFGAIAVFPFASAQARRSRLYDMMAAAGRSSFHDFDARGMRRPEMWVGWNQIPPTQGFLPYLQLTNRQPAESICIDPRMIAAQATFPTGFFLQGGASPTSQPGGTCVQYFPYLEPFIDANNNGFFDGSETLNDLNGSGNPDPVQFNPLGTNFDSSLMRRVTLRQTGNSSMLPSFNLPMSLLQADAVFRIDDDLAYDRPEDDKSLPPSQSVTNLSQFGMNNAWGRRLSEGRMSWLATLVPKFDISGVVSDEYTLSVVMLHERPTSLDRLDHLAERVVTGVWQDLGGATGGEIFLTVNSTTAQGEEQLKLRPNDWVMVSGTYPVSPTGPLVTRFQWYRISDCDTAPTKTGTGYEMYATLMGQDWNANFTSPPVTYVGGLPQVRVTIVQGAFAVYEKTIRLDYGSTF